ncbi:hypothetical protein [Dokdonella sp.]|uniref:hypothetical protein n=1 Tax=Dokdonella sp. TaxID=2291710 RepID=UPI0031BDCFDB|nr:hypothetical protein [Dokdonella sp.]
MPQFRSTDRPGLAPWFVFLLAALCAPGLALGDWISISNQLGPSTGGADFTAHGTQPGLAYSLESPDTCATCHAYNAGEPPTAVGFRPYSAWAGSMMANAMRDPLFLAALDVANKDVPGIGDYCLRCHTSNGWYGGRVVKAGYGQPDNDVTLGAAACLLEGGYDVPDSYSDYSGLACHFCHRNMAQGPGGAPLANNGAAWLDDSDCGGRGEPCRYGPYTYTGAQPPHAWRYSEFHTQSAMCGQCHDVTSPDVNGNPLKTLLLADGSDTGVAFPIERTYSEWQRSAYADPLTGETCQGCHMPMSQDPDASACTLPNYPNRTGNLPVHQFVGGNTWIPAVLKGEYSDTSAIAGSGGGIGREESFDQTVGWARELLQSAATVDSTLTGFAAPDATRAGFLALAVKVTNQSGHKLPTGYSEGRRMWLNIEVHDRDGQLVATSGAYDASTGVLTEDAQARVYEVQQGIWNHNGTGACDITNAGGRKMFHFALGNCIAKDNRIPPRGFSPATPDDPQGYEVRPVAASYPETAPGSGILVNHDTARYRFSLPAGAPGPFTTKARLYYQTTSKEYVEFLRDEAIANGTQGENQMCAGGPNRPFVVGPQDRTRGEYVYQLWNNPPNHPEQPGYGKSPPELMALGSSASGTDWIFVDGFDSAAPGH